MKKRELLKLLAQGSALASCPSLIFGAAQVPEQFRFGLQLSTLNRFMNDEFFETLTLVSEMGYEVVEFSAGGFLGRDPQQVRQHLAQTELSAPVGRVTLDYPANYQSLSSQEQSAIHLSLLSAEGILGNVKNALQTTVEMGQKYLNIPMIYQSEFTNRAKVENIARLLNEAGKMCHDQGVLLGYHNHAFEFNQVDGILPYDLLLAETDPALVGFQLDSYWVTKGGGDIMEYLRNHPGRFPSCHLKDIDDQGDFEDVGRGLIDFPAFIELAMAQGSKHFFVERDNPPMPMQSARNSFNYLSRLAQ